MCPPSTHSTLAEGIAGSRRARRLRELRRGVLPAEEQRRLGDRAQLLDGHVEEATALLGDDRRAVGRRCPGPPPGAPPRPRRRPRRAGSSRPSPYRSPPQRRPPRRTPRFKRRTPSLSDSPPPPAARARECVRVAEGKVDRDLAAVAAPDHDRRCRPERVDQRLRRRSAGARPLRTARRRLRENPRRS